MIADSASIQQVLLEWGKSSELLSSAVISEDGASISLSAAAIATDTTTTLDARIKLFVEGGGGGGGGGETSRTCEYSTGAIFLQIRDPAQGLVAYRNDCKRYAVTDPIKAGDKALVVSFFLSGQSATVPPKIQTTTDASTAATAPGGSSIHEINNNSSAVAAATADVPNQSSSSKDASSQQQLDKQHHKDRDKRHRESSSSAAGSSSNKHPRKSSEHARHHKSGTSSSRHHHQQQHLDESAKRKKKPDMVTNEQLFEHLNVVVDKRGNTTSHEDDALADAITAALSAKGFEIATDNENNALQQQKKYMERTAAIVANEIPVGNSASILRANNPRKDLTRVLELYMETINVGGKDGKGASSSSKATSTKVSSFNNKPGGNNSNSTPGGSGWKRHLVGKKPVIVVPKGMTAPITLLNAHEFLCHARFVPRTVMLQEQQQKGLRTPPTTFTRTIKSSITASSLLSSSGGPGAAGLLEYEIIDNPRKLGSDPLEWDRIVAVIVLGQSWQFKDWMKQPVAYNIPATLFDRVYGFYVAMDGDKIPADVAGWAVHRAHINRDKRNLDSVTYASFWNGLDEWMKVYKAELLPNAES